MLFFFSGMFQSVGWPLCVAIMTNWFPKKGRGVIFGFWASCVNIGNIWGTLICTLCRKSFEMNWEWTWIILNIIIIAVGVLNLLFLVAKPEYVGLVVDEEESKKERKNTLNVSGD
jgi:sugar phosphate permease